MNNLEESKRIKRKVVFSDLFYVYGPHCDAKRRNDELECGHIIRNKGSVKEADYRYCKECLEFREGKVAYENGIIFYWNPDTKFPVGMEYRQGINLYIDEMIKKNGKEIVVSIKSRI